MEEAVLKKQRSLVLNFKISHQTNQSQEKNKLHPEKNVKTSENIWFHFKQNQDNHSIKCFQSYDLGVSNAMKLIGAPNLKASSFHLKTRCLSASRPALASKTFLTGLKLRDIQYESGTINIKQDFLSTNYRIHISLPTPIKSIEKSEKVPIPLIQREAVDYPENHDIALENLEYQEDLPIFLPLKKENFPVSSQKQQDRIENHQPILNFAALNSQNISQKYAILTSMDSLPLDSFIHIPSLILDKKPDPLQQNSLSLKIDPIFKDFNPPEQTLLKQKVATFIEQLKIDETPGFNIKELAYFPESLSYEEVDEIKAEFKAIPTLRNHEKLDEILQRLKFFKKFNKIARINILRQTSLIEYQANERIFSEGDYGDLMYIIVKGSVNIKLKRKLFYKDAEPFEMVINSFYDGDHFGDLAMMSIKKSESSQNKNKPLNLNELTLKDVRGYLKKFYENKSNLYEYSLDAMAFEEEKHLRNSFLSEKKKNYFGLKEKDQKIERTKRTATVETCEKTLFLILKREKYQQIFFSLLQENLEEKIRTLSKSALFENFEAYLLLPFAYYLKEKLYKMGEVVINEGEQLECFQIIAKGRCECFFKVKNVVEKMKVLKEGDIIGGRTLMTLREFEKQMGRKNIDLTNELNSKLEVQVESPKCEILYIDKGSFELLPLDLKNEVRQKLITFRDFDDYPIKELKNECLLWDKKSRKIKSELLKKYKLN